MDIEQVILRNLQYNEDFARKVIPFMKEDYFGSMPNRICFSKINGFFQKYGTFPNHDALVVEVQTSKITESHYNDVMKVIQTAEKHKGDILDPKWLLEKTEQFCKDKALYLALQEAVNISNGENKQLSTTAIPDIMSKALAISFDSKLGHDYIDNAAERFDYYTKKVAKIPFHLDIFNKITNGGAERKTMNCVMAGTGVGKSLFMCDLAANYALQGYNVLYITLEMAEEKIAQRIDANLMNIGMSEFERIPQNVYEDKITQIKARLKGKIKIKEYPNFGGHVGHFRFLLREYKTKYNFVPDVIFIDYLNICASARIKFSGDSSYGFVKSVSEELRGLAVEQNVLLWTATQTNRSGINNSDVDITNTSESMGGPMTFDYYIALVATEELIKLGQVMVIQLKSRYEDIHKFAKKFTLGLDRIRMKFYDLAITQIKPQTQQGSGPVLPTQTPAPGGQSTSGNLNFKGVKV